MTRSEKLIAWQVAIAVVLLIAGLLGLDRALAEYLRVAGHEDLWLFTAGTSLFDTVSGKDLSKFLIGLLLSGGALVLMVLPRTRAFGRSALFVGLVQLLGTLLAGVSKNAFGRLRPFQLLETGDWSNAWFVGGSAFPSGHAGFYFGLFMPLAYLFPRWRWPLMLMPWFIAAARVDANDHFVSDVAASSVLVGVLTLLLARWLRQQARA